MKRSLPKSFLIISLLTAWTFCADTNSAPSETKSQSQSSNRTKGIFIPSPFDVEAAKRIEAFPAFEKKYNDLLAESEKKDEAITNLTLRLTNAFDREGIWKTLRAEDAKESDRRTARARIVFGLSGVGIGAGSGVFLYGLAKNEPATMILGVVLAVGSATAGVVITLGEQPVKIRPAL